MMQHTSYHRGVKGGSLPARHIFTYLLMVGCVREAKECNASQTRAIFLGDRNAAFGRQDESVENWPEDRLALFRFFFVSIRLDDPANGRFDCAGIDISFVRFPKLDFFFWSLSGEGVDKVRWLALVKPDLANPQRE